MKKMRHGVETVLLSGAALALGLLSACADAYVDDPDSASAVLAEEGAIITPVASEFDEEEVGLTPHELTVLQSLAAQARQTQKITNGLPGGNLHPEVVWLSGGGVGCSGVTISERWIATAGHCIDRAVGFPNSLTGTIRGLSVWYSADGTTAGRRRVYRGDALGVLYPRYESQGDHDRCYFPEDDFALIRLNSNASQFYRTRIPLIPVARSYPGFTNSGWGRHQNGTTAAGRERRVRGFVGSVERNASWTYFLPFMGTTADPGDSGSGVFLRPSNTASQQIFYGTVCSSDNGAATGPRMPWILAVTGLRCRTSELKNVTDRTWPLPTYPYYYGCHEP